MSTSIKNSRITSQAADQKMVDGFKKHAADIVSLVIGTATIKTADIDTVLRSDTCGHSAGACPGAGGRASGDHRHDPARLVVARTVR